MQVDEADAIRRRVYFHIVGANSITPAVDENGGQPQLSIDGDAWDDYGISTLTAIGRGRYYATIDSAVLTAGAHLETRYKSTATAECPGDTVDVVAYDPIVGPVDTAAIIDAVVAAIQDYLPTVEIHPEVRVLGPCSRSVDPAAANVGLNSRR